MKAYDQQGNLKVTTGGGGGGGSAVPTSAQFNALSNKVSTISQNVSVISQALSVETAARAAADVALSTAINVVSNALSNELSVRAAADASLANGISVVSNAASNALSVANAASQAASVVSNALSNEISNRISADNVLSIAINVVSNAASAADLHASTASAAATSANTHANTASAAATSVDARVNSVNSFISGISARSVGGISTHGLQSVVDALSNRISASGGGSGSVTSTELSAVSAQAASAIASETSNRISADNALSVAINVVSNSVSALEVRVSTLSANSYLSLKNDDVTTAIAGSPVYAFTSANTFKLAEADDIGARFAIGLAAAQINPGVVGTIQTNGRVTLTTGQWDALTGGVGGLLPGVVYYLQDTTNSLNTIIGTNTRVIGIAISETILQLYITQSDDLANAVSILSQKTSVLSQQVSVLSQKVSTISQNVSVISQQVSLISVKLSNTTSLATNTLAYITLTNDDTSAVSAGAPVYCNSADAFKRADADGGSTLPNVIGLVADAVIAIGNPGQILARGNLTLTTAEWDSITGQVGGLTPGSTYYLDTTAGRLTATAPAAGVTRPVGIAVNATRLQIQLSQINDWTSALSVTSAAVTSVDARVTSVNNNLISVQSTVSHLASIVSNVSTVSAGGTAVGLQSVINALSNRISAIPGAGSVNAVAFVSVANVICAAALTNISGLTVSVSAGVLYELKGMIMYSVSAATGNGFGLTFPAMTNAAGDIWGMRSVNPISALSGFSIYIPGAFDGGDSGSVVWSCPDTGTAGLHVVHINATFLVQTGGVIVPGARASVATNAVTIARGSWMRAFKLS